LTPAVKKGSIKAGKDYEKLERILFIPASYDENKQKALESIRFWRGSMIKAFFDVDVHYPRLKKMVRLLTMILCKKNYLLYLIWKKESKNYNNM